MQTVSEDWLLLLILNRNLTSCGLSHRLASINLNTNMTSRLNDELHWSLSRLQYTLVVKVVMYVSGYLLYIAPFKYLTESSILDDQC